MGEAVGGQPRAGRRGRCLAQRPVEQPAERRGALVGGAQVDDRREGAHQELLAGAVQGHVTADTDDLRTAAARLWKLSAELLDLG
ncbi:hypothetical protein JOF29_007640 [Kribbella aluminosa]|uniref:Uncharacterized protein n=1 Tax=Kribbella aluminosa TaxID=416017 RepID=A0ABS4UY27_9ACTN|nr:hypothetical protein [Kribbella aluminosa]MBP2356530.1 hypothetical protein [Kribbella aluminosa]